jgi:hypothetical protein
MKPIYIAFLVNKQTGKELLQGVFSDYKEALNEIGNAICERGDGYSFVIESTYLDKHKKEESQNTDMDIHISTEEQLEALKHYVNVAQRKTLDMEERFTCLKDLILGKLV